MGPKFLANLLLAIFDFLCFEFENWSSIPNKTTVARLKSNILPPLKILGYATACNSVTNTQPIYLYGCTTESSARTIVRAVNQVCISVNQPTHKYYTVRFTSLATSSTCMQDSFRRGPPILFPAWSMHQRWARIWSEATFGRIRTGSYCNISEIWRIRTGSDWENFSCFKVIRLLRTYQKFQLSLDFTDLLNGSVHLAINGKISAETILQFDRVSTFVHI